MPISENTQLPLTARFAGRAVRKAAAWFIPGDDIAVWLTEIARSDLDQARVKLRVLPSGVQDRSPLGVLVVCDEAAPTSGITRSIPYGRIGKSIFVPVDAELFPPVSASELEELQGFQDLLVFHPRVGLVAFESNDALRIADLLQPPERRHVEWGLAQPGVKFASRLQSIVAEMPPSANELLEQGREDIGDRQGELDQLPPAPGESRVRESAEQSGGFLKRLMDGLRRMFGGSERLMAPPKADESLRNRELRRLLHLLAENPDEGLKYALPLENPSAHRGQAEPSNVLGERDTNFNLSGLRGGGGSNAWTIDHASFMQIQQRYRELAAREMNLGKYRRAAYIFAHLLADLSSAAGALKAGRHWQEAAVLYRDKLNQPREAAKCLADGGLLSEAIVAYEELGEFETVGDLYRTLDDEERAMTAYEKAASSQSSRQQWREAARILEVKLKRPDAALQTLEAAWPGDNAAQACLKEKFDLLSRLGRFDDVRSRVLTLRDESLPEPLRGARVELLSYNAHHSPDGGVRELATDSTRIAIARDLPVADSKGETFLINTLRGLAHGDALLGRDAERFLRRPRKPSVSMSVPSKRVGAPPTRKQANPQGFIALAYDVEWSQFVIHSGCLFAAGFRDRELVLGFASMSTLKADLRKLNWRYPSPVHQTPRLAFLADPHAPDSLPLHVFGYGRERFANLNIKPDAAAMVRVEPLPNAGEFTVALTVAPGGLIWVADLKYKLLTIHCVNREQQCLLSTSVEHQGDPIDFCQPCMHARPDQLYIADGPLLHEIRDGKLCQTTTFERPIHSICGSTPFSLARVAIAFDQGAQIFWPGSLSRKDAVPFASDMENPVLGFSAGGHAIAVNRGGGEVFQVGARDIEHHATLPAFAADPVAILALPEPNRFGVAFKDGEVRFFEV